MKTSDLTGPALDWAVAKCEGWKTVCVNGTPMLKRYHPDAAHTSHYYIEDLTYSTDWSQGGPLLEREKLALTYDAHWHYDPTDPEDNGERWYCELTEPNEGSSHGMYGPTPLVAAMRTLVSSKLGPEIEIPQELV
jgi:hypothetical protein